MQRPQIAYGAECITKACEERLALLYPKGVPEPVRDRYEAEMELLRASQAAEDFVLFWLLSKEAQKSALPLMGRGTVMGSLLYFLLGNGCFNPLPPHYFCGDCGYYEETGTRLPGIDMPEKRCPVCGGSIRAEGFGLPVESVWGRDGKKNISFDYNVSQEFLPFARRVLERAYPQSRIVPWGMFQMQSGVSAVLPDGEESIGVRQAGFAVLPAGNTIQDYPALLSYLDDGEPCLTGGSWELKSCWIKPVLLRPMALMDSLVRLQRATGVYAQELGERELRDITWSNICNIGIMDGPSSALFRTLKPKSFKDMAALVCSAHNSFSWDKEGTGQVRLEGFLKMLESQAFQKYPCFAREDFFDWMLEAGVDRQTAFEASEEIWKGRACAGGSAEERFQALPIPEEIKEAAANYRYVFPRAHGVEYTLLYARLAWYAKADSRAFGKMVRSPKARQ